MYLNISNWKMFKYVLLNWVFYSCTSHFRAVKWKPPFAQCVWIWIYWLNGQCCQRRCSSHWCAVQQTSCSLSKTVCFLCSGLHCCVAWKLSAANQSTPGTSDANVCYSIVKYDIILLSWVWWWWGAVLKFELMWKQ